MKSRNNLRLHRKRRIRTRVVGTAKRPRLCVFRSNSALYVDLIDDEKGVVLYANDSRKIKGKTFDIKIAEKLGEEAGIAIQQRDIKEIVFDRGGYKYHGKVKAFAEGVRKAGLKF